MSATRTRPPRSSEDLPGCALRSGYYLRRQFNRGGRQREPSAAEGEALAATGIPLTPQCVKYLERRPYPPGVHGRARRKEDRRQGPVAREAAAARPVQRQRKRRCAGASARGAPGTGKTASGWSALLECRLDSLALGRLRRAPIYQARQAVAYGPTVDGRKVYRPSYRASPSRSSRCAEKSRRRPRSRSLRPARTSAPRTAPYLSTLGDGAEDDADPARRAGRNPGARRRAARRRVLQ